MYSRVISKLYMAVNLNLHLHLHFIQSVKSFDTTPTINKTTTMEILKIYKNLNKTNASKY